MGKRNPGSGRLAGVSLFRAWSAYAALLAAGAVVLCLAAVWVLCSTRSPLAPRIDVLFTGGLDGNLDGCECFGYPDAGLVKLGAYLDDRDRDRSVLVDAGDAWEAGSDAALAIELLGAFADLGYDAAAVGDQEFSNGAEFLLACQETGPFLGSRNLRWEGHALVGSGSGMVRRNGFSVLVLTLTQAEVFSLHPANFRQSLGLADPLEIFRGHLGVERPDLVLLVYHGTIPASLSLESAARAVLESVYDVAPPELLVIASHDTAVYPSPPEGRRDRAAYLDAPQRKRVEALPSTSRVFVPGRGGNRVGRIVVSRPLLSPPWVIQRTPTVLRAEYRVFNYRSDPDHLGLRSRVLRYNESFTAATGIERDYEVRPGSAVSGSETVVLDYFYSPNCVACQNFIHDTLPSAAAAVGRSVRLIKRNLMDPREFEALQNILSERGVYFQSVPVLVGPGSLLQGELAMSDASLEAFLHAGGAEASAMSSGTSASKGQINGFHPSLATVVAAGFLDGVNPCAFSTVIFLVSTLSLLKMRRHRLVAVGVSFCAGVFVTYYAVGLGAALLLRQSESLPILSRILRLGMAGFLTLAAGLSLYDAVLATRGQASSMVLQLPHTIKLKIHGLVRSHRADGAAAAGAFSLGAMVSVLELGCTGQIYLPTLVYLARSRGGAADYLWLALYNGAFILPLLAVFALALGGCSSQKVAAFFSARLGLVKGATAVLFVLLAAFLVFQ